MTKNKKIPRKKKKQIAKQQLQFLQQSQKVNDKELSKLTFREREKEVKRIYRNIQRQENRQKTKDFFLKAGLDERFINKNRLSDKKIESYSKADIAKLKRQNKSFLLIEEKRKFLQDAGIKNFNENDLKRMSLEKLRQKYLSNSIVTDDSRTNKIYEAKEYLYIGVAELLGGFEVPDYYNFTIREIEEHINAHIYEAINIPDGSDRLTAVFKVFYGSKEDCETVANIFYNRGYNLSTHAMKLNSDSFQKLTISNQWYKHNFLSMILACITQMANEHVPPFIQDLRRYCKRNDLPFMDNIRKIGK